MLTLEQFLQIKPAPIAIYGTDGGGIATDIYLRKLGLHERLACFLTTEASPSARFCGKPVWSQEILRQNPDMLVITANLDFNAVHNALRHAGLTNAFYYHASFWPWLDAEPPETDHAFLGGFFRNGDRHTIALLHALRALRYNESVCRIQPYAGIKDLLYTQDTYWLETRLLPDEELTIIDAGAFTGDTLQSLLNAYGQRIKRYYAFEPMPHIFAKLVQTAEKCAHLTEITCLNTALYDENAVKSFHKGVPRSSRLSATGDIDATCRRLDDLNLEIRGKACLKMDIEGMEMAALTGAAGFIKTYKPHLALCLYHKTNDLYKIPQYIRSLVPEYEFVLAGSVHTLCYGHVKPE